MGSLVRAHTFCAEQGKIPLRQYTHGPKALVGQAEMAQHRLAQFGQALTEEIGSDPYTDYIIGPLKTLSRAFEKAITRYNGDISAITDFCRHRILFNDPDQIKQLRSIFGPGINSHPFATTWLNRGFEVVQFKDYYMDPKSHGFIGLNLTIKVDLGKGRYHICELQFSHEAMLDVDKESHAIYEQIRVIVDTANTEGRDLTDDEIGQIGYLQDENRALYQYAANSLGLDQLKRVEHPYRNNVVKIGGAQPVAAVA